MSGQAAKSRIITPNPSKRTYSEVFRDRVHEQTGQNRGWLESGEDFIREVSGSLADGTARFYADRLTMAAVWMISEAREGKGVGVQGMTAKDVRKYIEHRQQWRDPKTGKPLSNSTIRSDAITLRVFSEFCGREKYTGVDILKDYKVPKVVKVYVKAPNANAVGQILSASIERWNLKKNPAMKFVREKDRAFYATRNFAILSMLADSSARIGEVLGALMEDYDRENMTIMFRVTKGGKPRPVQFGEDARAAIDVWLKARRHSKSEYLFCTGYGEKIEYKPFLQSYRKDCAFAGVCFSMHKLRHYATTEVANVNPVSAKDQAGHKSMQTTMGYVHSVPQHVTDAHRIARPLAKAMETNSVLVNMRSRASRQGRRKII